MHLESPAFQHQQIIPTTYTGEGQDKSPPLRWNDPQEEAAVFALIVEDEDVDEDEKKVHWLAYNIPGTARELPEDVPRRTDVSEQGGFRQGINEFEDDNVGYRGPFPELDSGRHRYKFQLYALRRPLQVEGGVDKDHLVRAMKQAAIIEEAELVGTYERSSKHPKAG